uniref:Putative ribonuclease H-like domain-containing protein n=1 Tax=Tanacetum cinerariifolium TaxID=118510 RepID=A0A6L2P5B6_TANCI|nr:putative ribonuclease H-like domain-containing protein [Tanacetum cinerariifolium]
MTTNADGTSTSTIPGPVTTEEKTQKKNDVKARRMLLMALPNEHLLTFSQYNDAKTLFEAIQARFSGNDVAKKTQKTLLKKMYKNFNAPSTESLDSIFNKLQKIVSQLAILGENIFQEDLNTNTNEIDTTNIQVSTVSAPVSTVNTHDKTANLSDATMYAFLANQPNGSQLVHEDLEQINEDDLEEIDLKWQLALLSMRARRYFQKTDKKITINGIDTAGYDKTKVECFNCHKMEHFARECRSPKNKKSRPRNQDSSKKTVIMEDTSSKAMVAIDGSGFSWSYMGDDEVPTNMALMAFLDSEVHNNKTCSNTCLKSFETLKTQYDKLRIEFNKSEFDLATYKRGITSVEEQLVFYKKMRMVQKPVLKNVEKGTGQRVVKPVWNNVMRVNHQNFSNFRRKFSPIAVLTKSGIVPISTASAVGKQGTNVVKSSTCWVWRPKTKVQDHVSKNNGSYICKGFNYVDPEGRLKKQILTGYQEYDRGFVAFAGSFKGGKITGKGKIRTGKLDFEDVYFVKELKFNLFSVSQMCDKKNNVLFSETECLILSPDFKLPDESQDETSGILKDFITGIENELNQKVKIIRCDNRTKFKNYEMNQFYEIKGIKREFGNARTPQQNRVAERKNMTLIEAAKTVLADSLLPIPFWDEAVNTAWSEIHSDAGQVGKEKMPDQEYILLPLLNTSSGVPLSHEKVESLPKDDAGKKSTAEPTCVEGRKTDDLGSLDHQMKSTDDLENTNSINSFNTASPTITDASNKDRTFQRTIDIGIFDDAYDGRDEGAEADYNNLDTVIPVSPIPFTRIHKDHPKEQIIGEVNSIVQTRKMAKQNEAVLITFINKQRRTNHKDFQNCLFAYFLSQVEPKKGHRQEEGIDYDEVFAPVARIEAISVKSASTPMETHKPLSKDTNGTDVDVYLYRSMLGSLMHLTSSRPDIMFDVCACSRFQVQSKVSHLHAVKRIFRYIKGQPTLGLWYLKDLPLDLIAYSDSDYACASLDRKSTTGGYQFLGSRLIYWQCKKQTIVANSTTEAEYIAASNCYGQVLWIQNQLLDYGYNFMQTKIHVDNESAICVVKNPVYHSKTKHIVIRNHFIRDSYEKRLIEMVKIHTDYNVTDLLTKAFDVTRF